MERKAWNLSEPNGTKSMEFERAKKGEKQKPVTERKTGGNLVTTDPIKEELRGA
jgi:hypothetical protein